MSYHSSASRRVPVGMRGVVTSYYSSTTTATTASKSGPPFPAPYQEAADKERQWLAARPVTPPTPECIPDAYYPRYWTKTGPLITQDEVPGAVQVQWEQLWWYDLTQLCGCIEAPGDQLALVNVHPYSMDIPVTQGGVPGGFFDYVAGKPRSQTRIDWCWTKALRDGIRNNQVHGGSNPSAQLRAVIDRANSQINQNAAPYKMGLDERALGFPYPCKYKTGRTVPGTVEVEQAPAAPLNCNIVLPQVQDATRRKMGTLIAAEKQVLKDGPLFHFQPAHSDLSVKYLTEGGKFQPDVPTAPLLPPLNIPGLNLLRIKRESLREKNPIQGIGSVYGGGIKPPMPIVMTQNLMIAGTVVAVLGIGAFIYGVTRKR